MDPNRLAHDAFNSIEQAADELIATTAPSERALIVDGTMYSPSTRAVHFGEHVYQEGSAAEWEWFQEELDDLVGGYERLDGWHLSWEDGCLWLYGPLYDSEAPDLPEGTILGTWRNDA